MKKRSSSWDFLCIIQAPSNSIASLLHCIRGRKSSSAALSCLVLSSFIHAWRSFGWNYVSIAKFDLHPLTNRGIPWHQAGNSTLQLQTLSNRCRSFNYSEYWDQIIIIIGRHPGPALADRSHLRALRVIMICNWRTAGGIRAAKGESKKSTAGAL